MTLKTFNDIIGEIRYEKYDGKKAIGYDFYKIQEKVQGEIVKWVKEIEDNWDYDCEVGAMFFIERFFKITEKNLDKKYPIVKRYENLEHLEHFNEDGSKK